MSTSAVTRIADSVLLADQSSAMVNPKGAFRTSLNAVTLLGLAQTQLSAARIVNVKDILSAQVKDICNIDEKPTKFLFGDDLSKRIKGTKETCKICSQISNNIQTKFGDASASRSSSTFVRPRQIYIQYATGQGNTHHVAHYNSFSKRGRKPLRAKRNIYHKWIRMCIQKHLLYR